MLDNLACMLNSNEQFKMKDSFQLAFVHVCHTPVGTGKRKKYLPGHQSSQRLKAMKRSCIRMQEDDEQLCTVRAIMTARSIHQAGDNRNEHVKWTDPKICVRRRDQAAQALFGEVGLRPGPYVPDELMLLATAPSLYDYKVPLFFPQISLFLAPSLIKGSFFTDHRRRR